MMETCKLLLENDRYDEAIDLLDSDVGSTAIHDRLFYMIITTVIEKGWLGRFSHRLSANIPSTFTADDLCNLISAFENDTNPTDVFASEEKTTVLEDLEPLFSRLLNKNCAADG